DGQRVPGRGRPSAPEARRDAHLARVRRGIGFAFRPRVMDIAERLTLELEETTARLRHDGHLALLDDGAFAVPDARGIVDELDSARQSIDQEMTLATRLRLRERAHRLTG